MFPYPPVRVWVLLCLMIVGATANLLAIDRLVPQEYATIQEAIVAAQTGDVVLVSPGTYSELIDFLGKTIAVRSTDGPAVTIIDGGGSGPIVTFQNLEGPGSVLEGFTITNGVAAEGAGITILDAYPTILNNTISSNTATTGPGGGIMMRNYTPNIDTTLIQRFAGNTFVGNSSIDAGAGAYILSNDTFPDLTASVFSNNSITGSSSNYNAPRAGGGGLKVYSLSPNGTMKIDDNTFIDNESQDHTGLIRGYQEAHIQAPYGSQSMNLVLSNSSFTNNTSANAPTVIGGTMVGTENLNLVLVNNSTFTSEDFRGLSTYYPKDFSLKSSSFTSTGTIGSQGFGTYGVQKISLEDNTFQNSTFYLGGGYIYYDRDIRLKNNTINQASDSMVINTYYGEANSNISIEGLTVTNTTNPSLRFSIENPPLSNAEISLNRIRFRDNTSSENSLIYVGNWQSRNIDVSIQDLIIDNTTFSSNIPTPVVHIDAFVGSLDLEANNILIDTPTRQGASLKITNYFDSYYGNEPSEIYSNINLRGLTLTASENDDFPLIQLDLDPTISNNQINIKDSILDSELPIDDFSNGQIPINTRYNLSRVFIPGEGNVVGNPIWTQGPFGNHYLSQISAGNPSDSFGLNMGDPSSVTPGRTGTRADGGLDTEKTDIGYQYRTDGDEAPFEIFISDTVAQFEIGTGLLDSPPLQVWLKPNQAITQKNSITGIRGVSLRFLVESSHFQIADVFATPELLEALGQSPEYFEVSSCGDVVTIGMIPSLNDNSLIIPISQDLKLFEVELDSGTHLTGNDGVIETQLIFQNGAGCGSLPVSNLATDENGNTYPFKVGPSRLTLVPYGLFRRIDANSDELSNIGDAIFLLGYLFTNSAAPSCEDAADVNDDGSIDVGDAIYLLAALFTNGAPPPSPGFVCGTDSTPDDLRCIDPAPCSNRVSIADFKASNSGAQVDLSWFPSGPIDHSQVLINGRSIALIPSGQSSFSFKPDSLNEQEICIRVIGIDSTDESCLMIDLSPIVQNVSHRVLPSTLEVTWESLGVEETADFYVNDEYIATIDLNSELYEFTADSNIENFCLSFTTFNPIAADICQDVYWNDLCENAVPLLQGNNLVRWRSPNTEIQIPPFLPDCMTYSCSNLTSSDIWFTYRAQSTGRLFLQPQFNDVANGWFSISGIQAFSQGSTCPGDPILMNYLPFSYGCKTYCLAGSYTLSDLTSFSITENENYLISLNGLYGLQQLHLNLEEKEDIGYLRIRQQNNAGTSIILSGEIFNSYQSYRFTSVGAVNPPYDFSVNCGFFQYCPSGLPQGTTTFYLQGIENGEVLEEYSVTVEVP